MSERRIESPAVPAAEPESFSKYELLDQVCKVAGLFWDYESLSPGSCYKRCRECGLRSNPTREMKHLPGCKVGRLFDMCVAVGFERGTVAWDKEEAAR